MRIVGDVEFESAVLRASFITPVPGMDRFKVWFILILELIHLSVNYFPFYSCKVSGFPFIIPVN